MLPQKTRSHGNKRSASRWKERAVCSVCGAKADGVFFGAVVCLPCKSFFIRSTRDGAPHFLCQEEKACDVTGGNRMRCQSCRYQRCLGAGMARREKPERVVPCSGQQLCRVCGDLANGTHFGVLTCEGCKKFFRRALTEFELYECKSTRACALNPRNRNNCRYCRYRKCLSLGMSRRAIKIGRPKKIERDMSSGGTPMAKATPCGVSHVARHVITRPNQYQCGAVVALVTQEPARPGEAWRPACATNSTASIGSGAVHGQGRPRSYDRRFPFPRSLAYSSEFYFLRMSTHGGPSSSPGSRDHTTCDESGFPDEIQTVEAKTAGSIYPDIRQPRYSLQEDPSSVERRGAIQRLSEYYYSQISYIDGENLTPRPPGPLPTMGGQPLSQPPACQLQALSQPPACQVQALSQPPACQLQAPSQPSSCQLQVAAQSSDILNLEPLRQHAQQYCQQQTPQYCQQQTPPYGRQQTQYQQQVQPQFQQHVQPHQQEVQPQNQQVLSQSQQQTQPQCQQQLQIQCQQQVETQSQQQLQIQCQQHVETQSQQQVETQCQQQVQLQCQQQVQPQCQQQVQPQCQQPIQSPYQQQNQPQYQQQVLTQCQQQTQPQYQQQNQPQYQQQNQPQYEQQNQPQYQQQVLSQCQQQTQPQFRPFLPPQSLPCYTSQFHRPESQHNQESFSHAKSPVYDNLGQHHSPEQCRRQDNPELHDNMESHHSPEGYQRQDSRQTPDVYDSTVSCRRPDLYHSPKSRIGPQSYHRPDSQDPPEYTMVQTASRVSHGPAPPPSPSR